MPKQTVVRCPKCGSTEAAADESKSQVDFTYMQCPSCGHGELVDSQQVKDDWNAEIELAPGAPLPKTI
jgi:predicted nucleic-acid-binding Zn-ribbon protein